MRIGMISQWYDPEVGSAGIPGSVVRALEKRGHRVEVVTGYPNYPTGVLYPGYQLRLLSREQLGGTRVGRILMYPNHGSGARRALNFLSFMVSASTLGVWLVRKSDVVLVYSTSATVGMAGVAAKLFLRKDYVLFVQDLWPDSVLASGMVPPRYAKPIARILAAMSDLGYRHASRIAVIAPGLKEILIERGVREEKIDVVYNWVDEEIFNAEVVDALPVAERKAFEVMYAGSLGAVQGLETAVEAIAQLDDLQHVALRFVGSGVAEASLRGLAERLGVAERVRFEGQQEVRRIPAIMATADVQLVCLKDLPLFYATMPSKTQAVLACGQPVIVSAPGDVAALVEAAGAGFVTAPENPSGLASAIRKMVELAPAERRALGERGRHFYETRLSAAVGAAGLEASLLAARSGG